jgi:TRAP-type mannitol/chloroaromatic compound transport system permease large subunit
MIGLIMFAAALLLLIVGYPVAFTFGAVYLYFGALASFF